MQAPGCRSSVISVYVMTVRQCRLKVVGLQYFCLCNDSEAVQAPGCRSSVTYVYVMTVRQCRFQVVGLQLLLFM